VTRPLLAAVDVGATKTLVLVGPTDASPMALEAVRIRTERDPHDAVSEIAAVIRSETQRMGGQLVSAGCGAPGPLDRERGVITHSPNLGWHQVPFGSALCEELGVRVALDDDARLGARVGAGRGQDIVAYVTVSSGIGGGIVIGGRLHHGANDLAGEIGHLTIDPNGQPCGCGRQGCVEAYAGGASLARRGMKAARGDFVEPSAEAVFQAASEGQS
jgi:glucokinase